MTTAFLQNRGMALFLYCAELVNRKIAFGKIDKTGILGWFFNAPVFALPLTLLFAGHEPRELSPRFRCMLEPVEILNVCL